LGAVGLGVGCTTLEEESANLEGVFLLGSDVEVPHPLPPVTVESTVLDWSEEGKIIVSEKVVLALKILVVRMTAMVDVSALGMKIVVNRLEGSETVATCPGIRVTVVNPLPGPEISVEKAEEGKAGIVDSTRVDKGGVRLLLVCILSVVDPVDIYVLEVTIEMEVTGPGEVYDVVVGFPMEELGSKAVSWLFVEGLSRTLVDTVVVVIDVPKPWLTAVLVEPVNEVAVVVDTENAVVVESVEVLKKLFNTVMIDVIELWLAELELVCVDAVVIIPVIELAGDVPPDDVTNFDNNVPVERDIECDELDKRIPVEVEALGLNNTLLELNPDVVINVDRLDTNSGPEVTPILGTRLVKGKLEYVPVADTVVTCPEGGDIVAMCLRGRETVDEPRSGAEFVVTEPGGVVIIPELQEAF
jgi:hypothetical protein